MAADEEYDAPEYAPWNTIAKAVDIKDLKTSKSNIKPLSKTTSAAALGTEERSDCESLPKPNEPFNYNARGRGEILSQRNLQQPAHLRTNYALEQVNYDLTIWKF